MVTAATMNQQVHWLTVSNIKELNSTVTTNNFKTPYFPAAVGSAEGAGTA